MVTELASRFDSIVESFGPLCVGIDPSSETLTRFGLTDSAGGAVELSRRILDGATDRVGIVKPQVAFFERFGSEGFIALETVIREAHERGLSVIADAKRGDIGSTMDGYATAWLGNGPLRSDALTVSPYQGLDALEPAFARADESGAVVFVLAATSNVDAATLQQSRVGSDALPALVARFARERSAGRRTVGVVVGATRPLVDSGLSPDDLVDILVLAPGFGAQGASLTNVRAIFGDAAPRVIPSVSRSVLQHGLDAVGRAIDEHLRELSI